MGYKRHMAWTRNGSFYDSFLCVCDRVKDHEVAVPQMQPDLELFTLTQHGEMRT